MIWKRLQSIQQRQGYGVENSKTIEKENQMKDKWAKQESITTYNDAEATLLKQAVPIEIKQRLTP